MSKTDIQKNRNKTVVISGSTSGLGKEMSIEFAKRGWVVAGFGKTKSKVDEITKIMGVKHQINCLLYTSPSPRDIVGSRMPSSA